MHILFIELQNNSVLMNITLTVICARAILIQKHMILQIIQCKLLDRQTIVITIHIVFKLKMIMIQKMFYAEENMFRFEKQFMITFN